MLCGLDHHLYQLRLLGCCVNLFSLQSLGTATRRIISLIGFWFIWPLFLIFFCQAVLFGGLFFLLFFYHQKALTVMLNVQQNT